MNIQDKYELPLTFRQEAVEAILGCIVAGESCIVIGIGSVGKSNLMRFLQRKDILREKLNQEWMAYLFVYIDINKLLEQSSWGLSELMLHQLIVSLTDYGADDAVIQAIDDLHERSVSPATQSLTLRYLDRAVAMVCNRLDLRIVFLMDDFDSLCRMLSAHGFSALRALRDDHKYRLMYVIAARQELSGLREEIARIEVFEELVSPHTVWLGPYSEDDARFMLYRLESRYGIRLEESSTRQLLAATGGHPGLLHAGYLVAVERPGDLQEALISSPRVQDECERIWSSLSSEEQRAIGQLAAYPATGLDQAGVLQQLHRKGMIGGLWASRGAIFSPLLAEYAKRQQLAASAHIYVDDARRIVVVDGRAVERLSPLEFKLVEYLEKNRNQVCSRDELAQYLYPDDMRLEGKGVSDARLDAVVKRVRERIEPVPKEPRYIVTVRGHGFCLSDGGEDTE